MKNLSQFSNRAFTLVELMTAIVIMGILAAIAGVSYQKYVFKAKMAEAHVGVANMSKSQVAYFIANKTFHSLEANPGIQIDVPGFPSGSIAKSHMLGGEEIFGHRTRWDVVGYPFAPRTPLVFSYLALVGKTDAAGSEVVGSTGSDPDDNVWVAAATAITYHFRPIAPTVSNRCAETFVNNYVTAAGKSQYNWAFIHASKDFKQASDTKCTNVLQVVDTDTSGKVKVGPIITENLGE